MSSNVADKQIQLDEEYQLTSEQILIENQMIFKSLDEFKRKFIDFDARLNIVEQQQKHILSISSQQDSFDNCSKGTNSSCILVEKTIRNEKPRSTCFSCRWQKKHCSLYFEDLYDFDKQEININIGADSNRLTCRCGHLIRIHERHP
ncbi:unnamed protein product, partial [Adineta steineri]